MKSHILSIGTELLLGDIVNTNAKYIAEELARYGVSVYSQSVVGDNEGRILDAFEHAFSSVDVIVTTGGLGPTKDDISKEMAAKYFDVKMYEDEGTAKKIKDFFTTQSLTFTDDNRKQALIPEGAKILENEYGTAPGIIMEKDSKAIIMLPGPPREMIPMWENSVRKYLEAKQDFTLISKVLRLCGIGESYAADVIEDLLASENPTVAPYAKKTECHLRITARAKDEAEAAGLIKPVADEIYKRIGDNIYAEDDTDLQTTIFHMLRDRNKTIAIAESCTGGMLTGRFVSAAGVSSVLKEGIVTYSNESKINRLKVRGETIDKYGAVSAETAREMAVGIARTSGADIGVSVTGIAGPGGGTKEKPVGLCYVGINMDGRTITQEYKIIGDRDRIRARAVNYALTLLWEELKGIGI